MSKCLKQPPSVSILAHFADLEDPRVLRTRHHRLIDIIVIAICGVICGAESWTEIEKYGKNKRAWLQTFLELPNGIPSHDTFGRVFAQLQPGKFHDCFVRWITSLHEVTAGRLVPIDGKTLRHSFDKATGKGPLHLVSAWAASNHLVLGQVAVSEKSNEITAIPELLKLLDLHGAIVTIDAMGCQKAIAKEIVAGGADYVLAVKGNQENLEQAVHALFEKGMESDFKDLNYTIHKTEEKRSHGRLEQRIYYAVEVPADFACKEEWDKLKSVCMALRICKETGKEDTVRARYYISTLPAQAKKLGTAIRGHWGIENSCHWVLDVSFREDESRIRKDHGPENMGLLRRLAVSLLKQAKFLKGGIHSKRLEAGWDNETLETILVGS
jgi:predicted transposase YbfD/YdcC